MPQLIIVKKNVFDIDKNNSKSINMIHVFSDKNIQ